MNKITLFLIVAWVFLANLEQLAAKTNPQNVVIDSITDMKELKKLFRTKTNMLLMFVSSMKESQSAVKVLREAAEVVKGQGTMVLIDCSNSEKKKICKKLKVSPSPVVLKHYKDGEFHKDYDRQKTVQSMVNFMRDPTGDLPWEEDPAGADVLHIQDSNSLAKFLKKETKPVMLMFYAPWCGFCKQLKPDYAVAATELKSKYVMAAIDVDRPENTIVRRQYNITGFPTLLYFENGKVKQTYDGENKKDALVAFMMNPSAPPAPKPKEEDWSTDTTSEIVHLTTNGFEPALKDEKSVLVMFYAPWCGHCKRMKPEYEKAAVTMKNSKVPGILAALDATKESAIAQKYGVKGYPTVKYFVHGEFKFDVNVREADKIVAFMKDPKEPPPPPPPEKPWDEEESEVVHLDVENFKPFLKKKKHALVMFYAPWCGHCKRTKPEFTAAASKFSEDPRVAIAAVDCTRHSSVCSAYEVRGYPTIKYFSYLKTVTPYEGGRTEKDFVKYLASLGATVGVSPADSGISGPVLEVNDGNFDVAIKRKKHALLFFYTEWCKHCKPAKLEYSEAAKKLSGQDILFAMIDAEMNLDTTDRFNVSGFPTILRFTNGNLIGEFQGERTVDGFIAFAKGVETKKIVDEL